jgi:hypothetical protein
VERELQITAAMTLLEATFAATILMVGVGAGSQLLLVSTQANRGARVTTLASMLARGKMEQLRGLDEADLVPSPPGSLDRNTDGYCDYLDGAGRLLGVESLGAAQPPDGTVFIRRWSVEPLPASPDTTIVLQVLVTAGRDRGATLSPGGAHLVSLRTRSAG